MKTILSLLLVLSIAGTVARADNDLAEVKAANDSFYSALNAVFTGDPAPMLEAWSHKDDVLYTGPMGGYQVGWKAISAVWTEQAALKIGGKVSPENVHIILGDDIAVACNYEVGSNLAPDGKRVDVNIRATNIYREEGGQWKMIHHHTDILPFLAGEKQ
ncbi:MAG: nuclear transport factor 2 family protein [Chthoniobacterales bacterium]|nr:nuclear transport factor 2 family protein [Chthoniobacterales bacterium]